MSTIFEQLASLTVVDHDIAIVAGNQAPVGQYIKGYAAPCAVTPLRNSFYLMRAEILRDILAWFSTPYSEALYLTGPTGSGKSSVLSEIAARLNYPVFQVTGHGRLEVPDLVGHLTLDSGTMTFQYGPLALAMKYGGLFLLDEIDLLDPATAAGLNGVLEGRPLTIAENGGEVVSPHPMFRFAATANTNGGSDETGFYQGALRQNLAFMDRFWVTVVDYPTPEQETALLERFHPELPPETVVKMVSMANDVRTLFRGEAAGQWADILRGMGSIDVTFSTRTLLRWARLTVSFKNLGRIGIPPIAYALDRALGFRALPESRAALHELLQRYFPDSNKSGG
ncbi:ATPase associated with various cellular activities family protein [Desulfovibrio sp. A2]|nr:ATPase associated with various cellular activities family protein [Desulfovibrio sp. A2]